MCVFTAGLFAFPQVGQAAATLPAIENTARVTVVYGGEPQTFLSNTVTTAVNPLVDVANTAIVARAGSIGGNIPGYAYSFTITNAGNTTDRFDFTAGFSNISAPIAGLWIDNDGSRLLDTTLDARLPADDATVTLRPGQAVTILVVSETAGRMRLTATSLNDDPAAVVRNRSASAEVALNVSPTNHGRPGASLVKTQTIDTRGAAQPGPGTIITYGLTSHLSAGEAASDVRISDAVPAGTTYVPGSLSLDGLTLSDAPDGDAGAFDASTPSVSVALPGTDGSTPDSSHTVRFQVRIN